MLFKKEFWPGIADGSVTVSFRRWKSARVVAGRPYRTPGGRIEVTDVTEVDPAKITKADAKRAGFTDPDAVRAVLQGDSDNPVFRVRFMLLDEPDPRADLSNSAELGDEDRAELTARLERMDGSSRHGPWTSSTLDLIHKHPQRRAPELAEIVGRETAPFKRDVRKLKELGLTHSFSPGYRLSPRGAAYLNVTYEPPDESAVRPARGSDRA